MGKGGQIEGGSSRQMVKTTRIDGPMNKWMDCCLLPWYSLACGCILANLEWMWARWVGMEWTWVSHLLLVSCLKSFICIGFDVISHYLQRFFHPFSLLKRTFYESRWLDLFFFLLNCFVTWGNPLLCWSPQLDYYGHFCHGNGIHPSWMPTKDEISLLIATSVHKLVRFLKESRLTSFWPSNQMQKVRNVGLFDLGFTYKWFETKFNYLLKVKGIFKKMRLVMTKIFIFLRTGCIWHHMIWFQFKKNGPY